jgi:hypothetical protein
MMMLNLKEFYNMMKVNYSVMRNKIRVHTKATAKQN